MQWTFNIPDQFSFICAVLVREIICHDLFNSHAHRVALTICLEH